MPAPRSQKPRWWLLAVVGALALIVGLWFGGHPSWLPGPVRSAFVKPAGNDRIIDDVLGLLQRDYYRKVNRSQLVDTGLAAAVQGLNDPYSHYYDPAEYGSFQSETDPHVTGVGVNINLVAQGLEVVDAFAGSPAARAGLTRGDVITAVGAISLAHRSRTFSANLIKGRPGTRVTLTILRGGRTRTISLVRANVNEPVSLGRILEDHNTKLGYVELTSFTQGSGAQVRAQVDKVLRQGAKGLILDLRQNGGGLLDEAVNVASIFIPDGTIVSTYGRSQPRQLFLAKGHAIAASVALVVLVDGGTASSAEIVTGALQDRGRAKVVGTHTYGKGVFQEIEPLPNGGALDFTVGEYFTPNGRNLGGGGVRRGAGITPDVYAYSNPQGTADHALAVAERTLAAELR